MKHALELFVAVVSLFSIASPYCYSYDATPASRSFIQHPVNHPVELRSRGVWTTRTGAWGESLVEQSLRLHGFNDIREFKHGGGNGIDRIAIRRGANGRMADVKVVEVKTVRSSGPRLGLTRYGGTQMSEAWLAENVRHMRRSLDPANKQLASEISRFIRGRPIESIGEVVHVDTRRLMLSTYSADGRSLRRTQSIPTVLSGVAKSRDDVARSWAITERPKLAVIQTTSMGGWIAARPLLSNVRSSVRGGTGVATIASNGGLEASRGGIVGTVMRRSVGRVVLVVSIAVDAKELWDIDSDYRRGAISSRMRNRRVVNRLGGMTGASAGASAGFAAGAYVGAFGGPAAWATVPAGAFTGSVIGGVGGYFGGRTLAEAGASVWYASIDEPVRVKLDQTLFEGSPPPLAN